MTGFFNNHKFLTIIDIMHEPIGVDIWKGKWTNWLYERKISTVFEIENISKKLYTHLFVQLFNKKYIKDKNEKGEET